MGPGSRADRPERSCAPAQPSKAHRCSEPPWNRVNYPLAIAARAMALEKTVIPVLLQKGRTGRIWDTAKLGSGQLSCPRMSVRVALRRPAASPVLPRPALTIKLLERLHRKRKHIATRLSARVSHSGVRTRFVEPPDRIPDYVSLPFELSGLSRPPNEVRSALLTHLVAQLGDPSNTFIGALRAFSGHVSGAGPNRLSECPLA
jgi:hypothetical protein